MNQANSHNGRAVMIAQKVIVVDVVVVVYGPNQIARVNKKLSYCWETVRRESMPRIAEMEVEMTT